MPDPNYYDLFGENGAPAAKDIARALQGRRAVSQMLSLVPDHDVSAAGIAGTQSADAGDKLMGEAGASAPFIALKQSLMAAQGKKENAEAGELGPQADLGGESRANYQAKTARMSESQWDFTPDPLFPGGMYVHSKRNPALVYYLDQDGVRPVPVRGQQGAPPPPPQGPQQQPGVPPQGAPPAGAQVVPPSPPPPAQQQQPPAGPPQSGAPMDPRREAQMEAVLVSKMPAEERQAYVTAKDVISDGKRALTVVKAHPEAFGITTNVAGMVPDMLGPLKGAIGTLQQNNRSSAAIKARQLVFEQYANTIHQYAGARGFSPTELPTWAQIAPDVAGGENAKVIIAKIQQAIEDATAHRARLRATLMPQLPPETPSKEDAAAAAMQRYSR